MANRWWVYQRERFPLVAHGPLIAAFSFSAVCYAALLPDAVLRPGHVMAPHPASAAVAFVTALIFFAQLRIADEWKDFEEDSRFRPYRPVPRGLVTLRELATIGVAGAAVQLALALWLQPLLVLPLSVTWLYLALMSKEFFARDWLKARPFTYMWSHMLIMPLIDFYATACQWLRLSSAPPRGLIWFLLISFCNGMAIEIGRKLRAPEDEETGVETYTAVWGRSKAVAAWLTALLLTACSALLAAHRIGYLLPVAMLLSLLLTLAACVAWRFLRQPATATAKLFEPLSGIWTLLMYLNIGAIPMLLRLTTAH